MTTLACDVLIVGAGTGGTAAALALADKGLQIILTEPTNQVGGQFTSQAVPPDEHPWIEHCGCTLRYRQFRNAIRDHYRQNENLTPAAAQNLLLNPGSGWVSHLCHSPAIALQILQNQLDRPTIKTLLQTIPVQAETHQDRVQTVTLQNLQTGQKTEVHPRFVLDATELGDLLPLTNSEYVKGAESQSETNEPNAVPGSPQSDNIQSFTWCAALGYDPDPQADHTIEKPAQYDFWKAHQPPHWPDRLLSFTMLHVQTGEPRHFPLFSDDWFNLFSYRQIVDPAHHQDPREPATIMNWPMNDYALGHVIDVPQEERDKHLEASRQLTLSMLYWLQTEHGYKRLRLRPDLTGTPDGLAAAPYFRESRRIRALTTIKEQDVAAYTNPGLTLAPPFPDSVGIGAYRIDLHPAANGAPTIDTSTLPFTIPLGALVPVRLQNLLPACKNIGTTHITNGCYRLHPIEWNIGESAALLALHCLQTNQTPQQIHADPEKTKHLQTLLTTQGIPQSWPTYRPL